MSIAMVGKIAFFWYTFCTLLVLIEGLRRPELEPVD